LQKRDLQKVRKKAADRNRRGKARTPLLGEGIGDIYGKRILMY